MGNTFVSLLTKVMAFFSSNVYTKTVKITPMPEKKRQFEPGPSSTFDETHGLKPAPLLTDPQPMVNIFAAHLAVDDNERNSNLGGFSEVFREHHKACVQVVSTTCTGSGVLLRRSSDTRLILLTAAHVIQEKISQLVIETNYRKEIDGTYADKITINLESTDITVKEDVDAALLFLSDRDSSTVDSKVGKFPSLSAALPSNTFMAIHYAHAKDKQVTVGSFLDAGNNKPITLQHHIDGGRGASGAPLFNLQGDVVAILQGSKKNFPGIRTFTPIKEIDELRELLRK